MVPRDDPLAAIIALHTLLPYRNTEIVQRGSDQHAQNELENAFLLLIVVALLVFPGIKALRTDILI